MTHVYQFSELTVANSVSGTAGQQGGSYAGTPWDTGRAGVTSVARPTTRTGLYDALVTALLAAGYTRTNLATRDDLWASTGEAGTGIRLFFRTRLLTGRYIDLFLGTKIDGANNLEGVIGGGSNSYDRIDLGAADTVHDLQFVGDLNGWIFHAQPTSLTTAVTLLCGSAEPLGAVAAVMANVGALAAGAAVTIDVTPSNPIALGYRVGDVVRLVEIDPASPARAESTVIVDMGANSIVVAALANPYVSARVGAAPMPVYRGASTNTELVVTTSLNSIFTSPLRTALRLNGDDLVADPGEILTNSDFTLLNAHAQTGTEFGTGTTPNARTLRFTLRRLLLGGAGNSALGVVRYLRTYNGTPALYPHDYGRDTRVSPTRDYTPFRWTNSSTSYYMLGPVPS